MEGKLELGDWVYTSDDERLAPKRIIGIPTDRTVIIEDMLGVEMSPMTIKGVPLTQEILHKNTYDPESNTYWVYANANYIQYSLSAVNAVKYYPERDAFMYEGIQLRYVHELQHLVNLLHLKRRIII